MKATSRTVDIAECVMGTPPVPDPTAGGGDPASSSAPYRVFNPTRAWIFEQTDDPRYGFCAMRPELSIRAR